MNSLTETFANWFEDFYWLFFWDQVGVPENYDRNISTYTSGKFTALNTMQKCIWINNCVMISMWK